MCGCVVSPADPPEVEVERSTVYTGEGYSVTLICFVYADPPAEVRSPCPGGAGGFDDVCENHALSVVFRRIPEVRLPLQTWQQSRQSHPVLSERTIVVPSLAVIWSAISQKSLDATFDFAKYFLKNILG